MDQFNIIAREGPIFALLGVLATVVINYIIQRSKGKTDIMTSERKTLSLDQENFRASILEQLSACRKSVDELTNENHSLHLKCLEEQERRLKLVEEVIVLKQKILKSSLEIEDLRKRLFIEGPDDKKTEAETKTGK